MLVDWRCFRSNPLASQRLAASLENVCGQNRANSATNFFYGFLRDAGVSILISGSISSSAHRPPQVPGPGGRLAVLPLTIDGDGPFDFVVSTGAHSGEKAEQSPLASKHNYFNPKKLSYPIALSYPIPFFLWVVFDGVRFILWVTEEYGDNLRSRANGSVVREPGGVSSPPTDCPPIGDVFPSVNRNPPILFSESFFNAQPRRVFSFDVAHSGSQ